MLDLALSGRPDSNRRPPAPKPERPQSSYQDKRLNALVRRINRSITRTAEFGWIPLVSLPSCYLAAPRRTV
jgi:hypothetical protein